MQKKNVGRSQSVVAFDAIGCEYNLPVRDHKYEIKYGLKIGEFGVKRRPSGYMVDIEKRARSVINPQKYSHQTDWKKRSKGTRSQLFPEEPNYVIPKAKRVTTAS